MAWVGSARGDGAENHALTNEVICGPLRRLPLSRRRAFGGLGRGFGEDGEKRRAWTGTAG